MGWLAGVGSDGMESYSRVVSDNEHVQSPAEVYLKKTRVLGTEPELPQVLKGFMSSRHHCINSKATKVVIVVSYFLLMAAVNNSVRVKKQSLPLGCSH